MAMNRVHPPTGQHHLITSANEKHQVIIRCLTDNKMLWIKPFAKNKQVSGKVTHVLNRFLHCASSYSRPWNARRTSGQFFNCQSN